MSIEIIDIEDTGLDSCSHSEKYHQFSAAERASVRHSLLEWYTANRRRLPWRGDSPPFAAAIETATSTPSAPAKSAGIASFFQVKPKAEKQSAAATASESKPEIKPEAVSTSSSDIFPLTPWPNAYATWVSEIMLQQTRVATVIEYFTKWMRRFPTVHALAAADPEEVNAMWAGLGYYRRARMLHQGAKMVVDTLNGHLPDNVAGLKQIPGIGDYTAGAIASIAFNQQAPLVDGNVIRVFCRMRGIAAHPKHKQALKLIWSLAGELVVGDRPGDFNQSLMELGANVCTPKSPSCNSCPVRANCVAFQEKSKKSRPAMASVDESIIVSTSDATPRAADASSCAVCDEAQLAAESADDLWAVTRYPLRTERKAPREEIRTVCVLTRCLNGGELGSSFDSAEGLEVLVVKRPESGLLAGQYEFPSAVVFSGAQPPAKLPPASELQSSVASILNSSSSPFAACFGASKVRDPRSHGSFLHVFSHLRQTSHVYHAHAGGTHGVASGVVCLVQPASVPDAESDSDQEVDDDEASTATKQKSKASNDKKAGLHSASWVSWKLLPSLGLALSAQKALELVTGASVASPSASTTKSNARPAAAPSLKPAKKAKSENSVTAFFSK